MKDIIVDDFQNAVSESLLRHKSIVDIITKLSESSSRINRAVAKSVTNCGCISIEAHKQEIPDGVSLDEVSDLLKYQIEGTLCDNCREVLEEEIGTNLYYLASLCDALDLNLFDVLIKEYDKIRTLGKFSLL
ncbi:hypothetical protein Q428_12485 [Fervidicella metallireducens AeB]|uniref:DUF1573 domain-containing protein n=1 Tax=Fervidicella metallireducens AeB TaxID=1403537 RepID=A0A017RSN2_9CLOT|nr:hypothetical protein [Fervidicella metallireducens]EYE87581.1 hypothetical protein Q428_12485 [Fervidicella metallireducens AeB]